MRAGFVPVLAFAAVASCGHSHNAAEDAGPPTAPESAADPTHAATVPDAEPIAAAPDIPYDLEADVRARSVAARARFGAGTPIVLEGMFVLIGADRALPFDRAVHVVHDALVAYFNGRFSKGPDRAVSVTLFARDEPYDAYC